MSIACICLLVALAADTRHPSSSHERDFLVELATPRTDYIQHEAIDLAVTVQNVSAHDSRMTLVLPPDLGRLRVHWRRPGAEFEPLDYLSRPDPSGLFRCGSAGGGTWGPGQGLVFHVPIGFDEDRRRFLLDELGEYQLKLAYFAHPDDKVSTFESNVVTITVVAVADGDRASFEAYGSDIARVAEYRMLGPHDGERAIKAGEYLERFPASPYAPPVLAGLKRYLGEHRSTLTSEETALSRWFGLGSAEDYITVIPGKTQ